MSYFLSSDEDDIEPNIVILKMQKPDPKGNDEFLDPIIKEGVTHGSKDSTKEGKGLQKGTHTSRHSGIKVHTRKRVADKVVTTRKALSQTSRALPTSDNVRFEDVINFAPATSNSFFKDDRDGFLCFEMDSISVSGYTTFQQRNFSFLYSHLLSSFSK